MVRPDVLYLCWVITLLLAAAYLAKLLFLGVVMIPTPPPQQLSPFVLVVGVPF